MLRTGGGNAKNRFFLLTFPICLVVWNMFFHILGTIHPNWLSYFSEGWLNHQPAMIHWNLQWGISMAKPMP
jgi:hypothetical protein